MALIWLNEWDCLSFGLLEDILRFDILGVRNLGISKFWELVLAWCDCPAYEPFGDGFSIEFEFSELGFIF